MNYLASLYYNQNKEKEQCLLLSKKAYLQEKNIPSTGILAIAQLWNDRIQASIDTIKEFLTLPDNEEHMEITTEYFVLLLAKQQTQASYDLFQHFPDLKQQIKPVYYALMTLLKEQYPREILKMGSELEETVQEVLERIEEKAALL
jgi:hypothetical protein